MHDFLQLQKVLTGTPECGRREIWSETNYARSIIYRDIAGNSHCLVFEKKSKDPISKKSSHFVRILAQNNDLSIVDIEPVLRTYYSSSLCRSWIPDGFAEIPDNQDALTEILGFLQTHMTTTQLSCRRGDLQEFQELTDLLVSAAETTCTFKTRLEKTYTRSAYPNVDIGEVNIRIMDPRKQKTFEYTSNLFRILEDIDNWYQPQRSKTKDFRLDLTLRHTMTHETTKLPVSGHSRMHAMKLLKGFYRRAAGDLEKSETEIAMLLADINKAMHECRDE